MRLTQKQKHALWLARVYGIESRDGKLKACNPEKTIVNAKTFNSIKYLLKITKRDWGYELWREDVKHLYSESVHR